MSDTGRINRPLPAPLRAIVFGKAVDQGTKHELSLIAQIDRADPAHACPAQA